MKRRNTIKRSGLRKRRAGKSAHSYGKLETKRCLASVGLDVAQTCDIDDAPAMVEQAVSENAIEVQSETPLRDRVVERLGDRGPRAEIRERVRTELAERGRDGSNMDPERQEQREERREERRERRGERVSIDGLKELVSTAREDGEVTEEERAEIRERVRTELAERGRDGSNMDPERQERREDRREQRDSDVDSQRREQLRERISARRAASGAFGRFLRR